MRTEKYGYMPKKVKHNSYNLTTKEQKRFDREYAKLMWREVGKCIKKTERGVLNV